MIQRRLKDGIGDEKYSGLYFLANTKVLLVEGGGCENDHEEEGKRGKTVPCQQGGGRWKGFFCDLRGQLVQVLYKHGG